jgi:tRNA(Arg) A34 adenosine deaminase TadA
MAGEAFMSEAIHLSLENMEKNAWGPFGCVIVKDGKIVGRGWNQVTSTNDPTAHAEMVAIRDACKHLNSFQLDGCDIYTSCEPCPMCLWAIYRARPRQIYYANTAKDAADIWFDDAFIYKELDKKFTERKIPMTQLLHNEALLVFQKWAEKMDKVEY